MMLYTNLWLRLATFGGVWRMFFFLVHRLQEDSPHSRWMLALQKPQTQQGMIFLAHSRVVIILGNTFQGDHTRVEHPNYHIPNVFPGFGIIPIGIMIGIYNWDLLFLFPWGIQNKYLLRCWDPVLFRLPVAWSESRPRQRKRPQAGCFLFVSATRHREWPSSP